MFCDECGVVRAAAEASRLERSGYAFTNLPAGCGGRSRFRMGPYAAVAFACGSYAAVFVGIYLIGAAWSWVSDALTSVRERRAQIEAKKHG